MCLIALYCVDIAHTHMCVLLYDVVSLLVYVCVMIYCMVVGVGDVHCVYRVVMRLMWRCCVCLCMVHVRAVYVCVLPHTTVS